MTKQQAAKEQEAKGEESEMVELRVPWSDINLMTGDGSFGSGFASLAETALNPEFRYLAKATGDCALWRAVDEVQDAVVEGVRFQEQAIAAILLSPDGTPVEVLSNTATLGARGDSFYEYLLKDWLLFNRTDNRSRFLFDLFLNALPTLFLPTANGLVVVEVGTQGVVPKMDHLVCFLPGSLALDALQRQSFRPQVDPDTLVTVRAFNDGPPPPDGANRPFPLPSKQIPSPYVLLRSDGDSEDEMLVAGFAVWMAPAPIQFVMDAVGADPLETVVVEADNEKGCEELPSVEGKVLVVIRGNCTFEQKAWVAERAGAVLLLIMNDKKDEPLQVLGRSVDEPTEKPPAIPVLMVYTERKVQSGTAMHVLRSPFDWWHTPAQLLNTAEAMIQSCANMYIRVESGLAPEITRVAVLDNVAFLVDDNKSMHHLLRPETVESLMYLHRGAVSVHRRLVYRNLGWRFAQAWEKFARTAYGYTGLRNVRATNVTNDTERYDDVMPSYFFAETLKYLLMLFDETVLPLDKYVLNTEGHPLPISDPLQCYDG
jgi:mannosyl-oligosaccharide alpha-1,2-mannosidase